MLNSGRSSKIGIRRPRLLPESLGHHNRQPHQQHQRQPHSRTASRTNHQMYCVKTMLDCNTVYGVGTDKFIQQFDLRASKVASKISTPQLAGMNYISTPQNVYTMNFNEMLINTKYNGKYPIINAEDRHELLIAHQDGSITTWYRDFLTLGTRER